ncbi:MAG: hypothetical protein HKL79_03390 [Thermoplasmata archaeon]|nr:hypothetical protein [Thermoplasmata archaeon]
MISYVGLAVAAVTGIVVGATIYWTGQRSGLGASLPRSPPGGHIGPPGEAP